MAIAEQSLSRRRFLAVSGVFALGSVVTCLSACCVVKPTVKTVGLGAVEPKQPGALPALSDSSSVASLETPTASIAEPSQQALLMPPPKDTRPLLNPRFGIRNDDSEKMYLLLSLGAKWVRINGHFEDLKSHPEALRAVREAKKSDLSVALVYNPGREVPEARIKEDLNIISSELSSEDAVELGNEGDNPLSWENGDIASYARFNTTAYQMGRVLIPDLMWIMGSMSNNKDSQSSYQAYGKALRELGFDGTQALFAVHTYDHVWDTDKQLTEITQEIRPAGIIASEVGAGINIPPTRRAATLISLLDRLNGNVLISFIHELNDANGSGLINPRTGQPEKAYYDVQDYLHKKISNSSIS